MFLSPEVHRSRGQIAAANGVECIAEEQHPTDEFPRVACEPLQYTPSFDLSPYRRCMACEIPICMGLRLRVEPGIRIVMQSDRRITWGNPLTEGTPSKTFSPETLVSGNEHYPRFAGVVIRRVAPTI